MPICEKCGDEISQAGFKSHSKFCKGTLNAVKEPTPSPATSEISVKPVVKPDPKPKIDIDLVKLEICKRMNAEDEKLRNEISILRQENQVLKQHVEILEKQKPVDLGGLGVSQSAEISELKEQVWNLTKKGDELKGVKAEYQKFRSDIESFFEKRANNLLAIEKNHKFLLDKINNGELKFGHRRISGRSRGSF